MKITLILVLLTSPASASLLWDGDFSEILSEQIGNLTQFKNRLYSSEEGFQVKKVLQSLLNLTAPVIQRQPDFRRPFELNCTVLFQEIIRQVMCDVAFGRHEWLDEPTTCVPSLFGSNGLPELLRKSHVLQARLAVGDESFQHPQVQYWLYFQLPETTSHSATKSEFIADIGSTSESISNAQTKTVSSGNSLIRSLSTSKAHSETLKPTDSYASTSASSTPTGFESSSVKNSKSITNSKQTESMLTSAVQGSETNTLSFSLIPMLQLYFMDLNGNISWTYVEGANRTVTWSRILVPSSSFFCESFSIDTINSVLYCAKGSSIVSGRLNSYFDPVPPTSFETVLTSHSKPIYGVFADVVNGYLYYWGWGGTGSTCYLNVTKFDFGSSMVLGEDRTLLNATSGCVNLEQISMDSLNNKIYISQLSGNINYACTINSRNPVNITDCSNVCFFECFEGIALFRNQIFWRTQGSCGINSSTLTNMSGAPQLTTIETFIDDPSNKFLGCDFGGDGIIIVARP
ncbi:MAG: hypothetical protein I8H75_06040 [Myxococcaceae bacterium]|nr:hypothetical protein [Myxococcaceae bacterium]MBH2006876.1 hypothetical protein [Myxococcaceae bacterium]